MADLKVSELQSANVVQKGDLLYLVQGGTSKNANAGVLFASIVDPTLSGNVSLGGNVQTLSSAGTIDIKTSRTELIGGLSANTNAIANGNILPSAIFLYTPGISGTGVGFNFVEGPSSVKTIIVSYSNNKIKLNGYFPNEYTGSGGLRPFPDGYSFIKGSTYVFDVSNVTNTGGNTLSFSTSIDGTNTLGTEYTANVSRNGTPGTAGANIVFRPGNVTVDTGGTQYLSIPKGSDGQLKIITLVETLGGSYSISGNIQNNLNISFKRGGDSVMMLYSGNAWSVVGATPGFLTTFSGTSDDVTEGSKLFFTNTRARAAISPGDASIIYDQANGKIRANLALLFANANINISLLATTDDIAEGPLASGNLALGRSYFTNARAVAAVTANINTILLSANVGLAGNIANVIFVATNGDDNNPGNSLEKPLANIHTALSRANAWTTVRVASGQYTLYNNPVTIKARVGLVGENLRTTSVYPQNPTLDMFYVENGSYVTGFTFRGHLSPSAVFSYNPDGSAGTIVTSPYIQNCSSITTTGTGMRVDGRYVTGLRSMVCDSYTQTNEGGIGIHMLNRGYTQLVSVFTICCNIGILCEDGGFCSVTNSNTSFGTYGLVARGVSDPLYSANVLSVNGVNSITLANLDIKPNYGDAMLIANFNQTKCSRDTGLIVDALAFDLLYNGNTESTFAGLQYYAQSSSAVPGQAVETIAAINYAKRLAANVILNINNTPDYQGANVQTIDLASTGNNVTVAKVNAEFDIITNIIANGTVGVTDLIIPNLYPANTNANLNLGANLLFLNKNYIQSEVVAYVQNVFPAFSFDTGKCFRDVGYIIDSIVFDLRHDGNKQAVTSGVYYYNFNANVTQINNQVVQTGAAYDFIGSLVGKLVRNLSVAPYDAVKCARDANLIVDSLVIDLAYGSNTQAVFAGLQYWAQSNTEITGQVAQTIVALNYTKALAMNVIANTNVTSTFQVANTQVFTSGLYGTGTEVAFVNTEIDLITNIIANGTVGVTDRIVPNQYPATSNATIQAAANLLLVNNAFIKSEVVAYIQNVFPSFSFDANTCARDVGFILESITFDLRHGGNRQAIMSGVYYYNNSSTNTQIYDQVVQTGAAYNFISSIVDDIVTLTPITNLYQNAVTQNTSAAPAATIAEANLVIQNINLIKNIITNGPNVAPPKRPIIYNTNATTAQQNAARLINANKNFIVAEVIGYVDAVLFNPPYQKVVLQNTTAAPAATLAEANVILNNIDLLTNIITIGPNVAGPARPIGLTANTNPNVINAGKILLANKNFIKAEVLEYVNQEWANISNGASFFYTVDASTNLVNNTSIVTTLEALDTNILANNRVSFHTRSYISASGQTMEYVGAGDILANALPYLGGVPVQENEVVEERGGAVYYTSTDHKGDFRIGDNLLFNRVDGTITGRTFTKALFTVLTPYILAIEG